MSFASTLYFLPIGSIPIYQQKTDRTRLKERKSQTHYSVQSLALSSDTIVDPCGHISKR
ncbi:hypothetical protein ccbrp13_66340 [Ktedonobacteria bacterium brp13]|nr:hypothetical protein ccbrp13_66340 [Ktedonobacteria bacterium brp13]